MLIIITLMIITGILGGVMMAHNLIKRIPNMQNQADVLAVIGFVGGVVALFVVAYGLFYGNLVGIVVEEVAAHPNLIGDIVFYGVIFLVVTSVLYSVLDKTITAVYVKAKKTRRC